jgi:hypothetical protein
LSPLLLISLLCTLLVVVIPSIAIIITTVTIASTAIIIIIIISFWNVHIHIHIDIQFIILFRSSLLIIPLKKSLFPIFLFLVTITYTTIYPTILFGLWLSFVGIGMVVVG